MNPSDRQWYERLGILRAEGQQASRYVYCIEPADQPDAEAAEATTDRQEVEA